MNKIKNIFKLGIIALTMAISTNLVFAEAVSGGSAGGGGGSMSSSSTTTKMVDYCLDSSGNIRSGVNITGHFTANGVPYVVGTNQTIKSVYSGIDGFFANCVPSTILDGKHDAFYGGFAWGWSSIGHGSYIQLDLGAVRAVNQIGFTPVSHGDDYWRTQRILVSNDESFETFTQVCPYTLFEQGKETTFDFSEEETLSFRYLRILTYRINDSIAATKRLTVKGYCDDLFENWSVPEVTGPGKYDVTLPVTHYNGTKQYSMQLSAYSADGKLTAFSNERVEASSGVLKGSIIVPEGTEYIRAALVNNVGQVIHATEPSEDLAGTYQNETVSLSGSSFAEFTVDNHDVNISALGDEDDYITVYVLKNVDKSKSAGEYFDELDEALGSNVYFTAVGKSKDGIKFHVPFGDELGIYYFRVVKSGKNGSESVYYRYSMVTDEKKQEFVDSIFSTTGGEDYNDIVKDFVDDLEIITDDNVISVSEIKQVGFDEVLVKTRDMMYNDGEAKELDDVTSMLNSAIVINRMLNDDYAAAGKDIDTCTDLKDFIGEYSSYDRFAQVAGDILEKDMNAIELEKALKHGAILSHIQDGTAQEIADILEKHGAELGVDTADCVKNGVELTRVAARLDNQNASAYYGDGLATAFANAIAAEKSYNTIVSNTTRPTGNGGGGGGGGNSFYVPITKNDTVDKRPVQPAPTGTVEETVSFTDLAGYEWAKDSIARLTVEGVLNGYTDGSFRPHGSVSRAEFVKMLVMGLEITVNEKKEMHFIDCSGYDWFYPYIAVAYSVGCINGVDEYTFGVSGSITRQDLAVMLYNAIQYKGNGLTMNEEKCTEYIPDYAREAFNVMIENGIITGYSDGSYKPDGCVTRAEAAVILCRVIDFINGGTN